MTLRQVQKRDGRVVAFDKSKIAAAVARAQQALGDDDASLAADVADLVELALGRRYSDAVRSVRAVGALAAPAYPIAGAVPSIPGPIHPIPTPIHSIPGPIHSIPGIEEIQDLVEQALVELGHARLAKAYILYRDRRARVREALQVHGDLSASNALERAEPPATGPSGTRAWRAPRVQRTEAVGPWNKARIVAALMSEADLSRSQSEAVASRVEERVFESGFRRISTALIRELVDNELVEMGLARALSRHRPVGIARHDLRAMIAQPGEVARAAHGAVPEAVERAVGGEILRRFALEDVLGEATAELHLSGELFVEALDRPHLPLVRALPAELLLSGATQARAAFDALSEIAWHANHCAYGVVIEDCAPLLRSLARGARSRPAALEDVPDKRARREPSALAPWLAALAALARAAEKRIDLVWNASSHAPAHPWLARVLDAWVGAEFANPAAAVRLFVASDELARALHETPSLAARCAGLLQDGALVPTWNGASERFAGPGLVRRHGERGALCCGGAVALNLPRLARRAGPWREDALLESLAELVERALDGLASLAELQRTVPTEPSMPRLRASYALTAVGLAEAMRTLGDGELSASQGARVLSFVSEAASRFGRARGLSVTVTPHFGERARVHFAELDARHFAVSQPLLFDWDETGARAARVSDAPYGSGFDLGARGLDRDLEADLAAVCASVDAGAIGPPSALAALAVGSEDEGSSLNAWLRVDRLRERARQRSPLLFALPRAASARGRELDEPSLPFALDHHDPCA